MSLLKPLDKTERVETEAVEEGRLEFMAFATDTESEKLIGIVAQQLLIQHPHIERGDISTAIETVERTRSPRYLVVDLSNSESPMEEINNLADICEPGVKVVAIGDQNDVGLYRNLMRAGVSDYLLKPLDSSALHKALVNSAEESEGKIGNTLAHLTVFMGVRGGVGTSTVASNIAYHSATQNNLRTALLDLDLQTGVSSLLLDTDPVAGLLETLEDPRRTDNQVFERLASKLEDKLFLFGSEAAVEGGLPVSFRGLEPFLKEVRQHCHLVTADVPRHMFSTCSHLLRSASTVVLVTDLSLAGLRDTARYARALENMQYSGEILMLANKVNEVHSDRIKEKDIKEQLGRSLDLKVSFDMKACSEAEFNGRPLISGTRTISRELRAVANRVSGRSRFVKRSASLLGRLMRR
ncbi:MinD/ParA family protein [Fodinicurvata sediminis]|uniref:MinD/ParA family protein n=1 Tax=Fodinicurvata sediminis TaxID=1121832 RepID=UPI0003B768BD|nr:MinD/ParA family protein [Fodinicurvata sediminis]